MSILPLFPAVRRAAVPFVPALSAVATRLPAQTPPLCPAGNLPDAAVEGAATRPQNGKIPIAGESGDGTNHLNTACPDLEKVRIATRPRNV